MSKVRRLAAAVAASIMLVASTSVSASAGNRDFEVRVGNWNCSRGDRVTAVQGTIVPSSDQQTGYVSGNTFVVDGVPVKSGWQLYTVTATAACKGKWWWSIYTREIATQWRLTETSMAVFL